MLPSKLSHPSPPSWHPRHPYVGRNNRSRLAGCRGHSKLPGVAWRGTVHCFAFPSGKLPGVAWRGAVHGFAFPSGRLPWIWQVVVGGLARYGARFRVSVWQVAVGGMARSGALCAGGKYLGRMAGVGHGREIGDKISPARAQF